MKEDTRDEFEFIEDENFISDLVEIDNEEETTVGGGSMAKGKFYTVTLQGNSSKFGFMLKDTAFPLKIFKNDFTNHKKLSARIIPMGNQAAVYINTLFNRGIWADMCDINYLSTTGTINTVRVSILINKS